MKVVCFHGRGSNNEIFELQTASIRAELEDFEFHFIQGTIPHTEGNWSLFTTSFSQSPLYGYVDPLSPRSVLQTEEEVFKLIEEEGPFDGAIGYSGGASIMAQVLIKDFKENPWKVPHERVFHWAVFINGATPLETFRLSEVEVGQENITGSELENELREMLLRPSNLRQGKGAERHPGYDPRKIERSMEAVKMRQLKDSRICLSDSTMGAARYDAAIQGILIDIPTLHIQCPTVENRHWGFELEKLCEPSLARRFFHNHGHDFPRGHFEIKKIAQLIREIAET